MSSESRAAHKARLKSEQAQIKRVRETEGWRASMKLAFKLDWANFLELPWYRKPLRFLRYVITIPITLLVILLMIVGAGIFGLLGLIVIAFMDHFWESFAVTCFILAVMVLFVTGVL